MNQFKFSIIDYTTNPAGDTTVIDEPVGWDALSMKLKRDEEWHGFFDYFDSNIKMLQFDSEGYSILKDAYEAKGVNANVEFLIEYACSETDNFEELYTGKFVFAEYVQHCGDRCYIEIGIGTTSCLVTFKTRYNQKVDIDTLESFDGETLSAYSGLGFEMELASKLIVLKSWWEAASDYSDMYYTTFPDSLLINQYIYSPSMPSVIADITQTAGGIFTHDEPPFNNPLDGASDPLYWVLIAPGQTTIYGNFDVDINIEGVFSDLYDSGDGTGTYENVNQAQMVLWKGADWASAVAVSTVFITGINPYGGGANSSGDDFTMSFSAALSTNLGTLLANEGLFLTFNFSQVRGDVGSPGLRRQITFQIDDGSYVRFTSDTLSEPTNAKVYLINEVASRATEAITNDCLRVYSDLFGRTDAEPYNSADDGCGGLEVVSSGLMVRRSLMQDGTEPKLTLSMKQIFEALNAVWNIGMGVEDDPNRPGYQWLRIELFQYFYSNTVLVTLDKIAAIKKECAFEKITSLFKIGYSKWEAEQFNGLDEFLTKREFRTTQTGVNNELQKLCDFIASGYAIEVTRRQVGNSSKDWRYDNETFLICVVRNGGDYEVEQATINATNIIDPATVYNTRISPARNARRWMPIVFQCYVDYANGVLKFVAGDGNIVAESNIVSADAACIVEDTSTPKPVVENAEINYTVFDGNAADFYPIFKPERISFQYPLSYAQWKTLKASPTGLIGYECGGVTEYGWIDEISYRPVEGIADFVLIPQQPELISIGGG